MEDVFRELFHNELTAERDAGRRDGITIGEAQGEARGIVKGFASLVRQGLLSLKDAATNANMSEDDFSAQMAALGF